ncbi:MAG: bile acid:sodium symporter family protein [Rhodocyclales bacterium]|nr:bile acid:sodium symporter family protein [Rhodocyclales bacterium]
MNPLLNALLPLALAFILFSLGLGLVVDDFRRVLRHRQAVAVGLICQIGLLPVIAFALAALFRLPPEMAIGLVILGACPGGMTSGLLTHLARGDTALSVTLTAVSSVATVFTLPLVVAAAVAQFSGGHVEIGLSLADTVKRLFILTTLPVVLGMSLRHFFSRVTERVLPWVGRAANLCFAVIAIGTFVSQWPALRDNAAIVGSAALALNVLTMSVAWWVGQRCRVDRGGRIAIAMECGLQNAALGIFVANNLLNQPVLAIPSVVYALLMNFTALALVLWARGLVGAGAACASKRG